jgi:ribose transport system permease protein
LLASRLSRYAVVLAARYWLLMFLVIEFVVFSILQPNTFMMWSNIQTILLQQAVPLVAALALTFPLVVGEFDLSVGNLTTGAAVIAAGLMGDGLTPGIAVVIAVAGAGLVGVVTALLVARFQVNSFIGTLGVATVITGFIDKYTGGLSLSKKISPTLTNLATDKVVGVPLLAMLAGILALLVWFVLQQTVYGRQLSALGANRRAAELLGLRTSLLVISTFVLSSLLAGLAGIVQLSVEVAANPTSGGFGLVVSAITAVFLGATCFRPGHFNVGGTIVALLFLAFGVSGLSLVGLAAWVQNVFTGVALVLALAVAAFFRRAAS